MLKKIVGNFQTILTLINSDVKSNHRDVEYKNLGFKVYDENESKSIMILIHGFGGNQDATYIKTFIDKLSTQSINVLTFDAPGIGKSIKHKQFWGSAPGDQGLLDDVIEWIVNQNKWNNIFVTGYSAGGGFLLSYLCGGGKIINKYKDKITYSFFVSPTIKHGEMLRYIQKNNGFIYNSISILHTMDLIKHRLYHKKFCEIPHIIKNCTFNIVYSNIYGSGNRKVIHKINPPTQKINGLAIISEDDPITPFHLMLEYKYYCDVYILTHGGHVGFYNIDGSRESEKIILKKTREIIEQNQE